MQPVGHHFHSKPFSRSNKPRSAHTPLWTIFVCYSQLFFGLSGFDVNNAIFFVKVRQDLVYASSWPSRPIQLIFKVKRVPKLAYPSFQRFSCAIANHFLVDPDSDVNNAKFFCGLPSRPCLCIRLALTELPTHFEGQKSPEASIPFISMIFVCYSKPFFR